VFLLVLTAVFFLPVCISDTKRPQKNRTGTNGMGIEG